MKRLPTRIAVAVAVMLVAALAATAGSLAAAGGAAGAVYTLSNDAAGNAVLVFARAADGTITPAGTVATGGLGSGGGLGSQGAIVLNEGGSRLYAVNAGSNEISSFAVGHGSPALLSKVDSGGVRPISVTVSGRLVYVLNEGNASHPASIAGFRVDGQSRLSPLPGSTRPLSGPAVGPAQIQFAPNGHVLVVTEKETNTIDTYAVGSDGLASGPNVQASAGTTPFGFDFDRQGRLIVSDAFGGAPNASGLSSYSLSAGGALGTISPFVGDGQTAACWVVTTRNGPYAYTTNTGSANVSSFTIGHDGSLSLLNGVAGTTGSTPIDAADSRDSRFLYTLDSGARGISAFAIGEDGSLTPVAGASGLPAASVGLAAD